MKTGNTAAILLFALVAFGVKIGDTKAIRSRRIVGGSETDRGEFNYVVSFSHRNEHYCSGVIISPRHIITAAHCILDEDMTIHYGSHDLRSSSTMRSVPAIHVYHSMYFDRDLPQSEAGCDISIVELDEDLEIDNVNTGIISLAQSEPDLNARHVVAGFGNHRSDDDTCQPPVLRRADIRLLTNVECVDHYGEVSALGPSRLCAIGWGSTARIDNGDSGAPLVNSNNELVGVASFSSVTSVGLHYYTNLHRLMKKIKQVLDGTIQC